MARNRRQIAPSNLSFLDIMSCGFGAAVLLFLIIKHNIDSDISSPLNITAPDLQSEISLLEEEIHLGEKNLVAIKNTIEEIEQEILITQGLAQKIEKEIAALSGRQKDLLVTRDDAKVDSLKSDLIKLEQQKKNLEKKLDEAGVASRKFVGDGDRAYVSGLKMSGKYLLILLDSSASMLDKTIVNIIRRRNMSEDRKRNAPKWQHAIRIVEWLAAKFPLDSQFQIYHFNTDVEPLVTNSQGRWLYVKDKNKLDDAFTRLAQLAPTQGTNLEKAFMAVNRLNPKPDSIYLITDGLPTQGAKPPRNTTISSKDRMLLFDKAVKKLSDRIPVNIILTPIEGDPNAAITYWRLARATQGSFMSPASDWP